VSTTNGSAVVLGTQTRFGSEAPPGTTLRMGTALYTVEAVASDTSLTIGPAFPAAPVPVIKDGPAWIDAGVSLLCADAGGTVRLQLLADGALHAGPVVANGSVTATAFVGDGAGLSNIPVGALTGTFQPAQIPDIPISKVAGNLPAARIGGTLSLAQLPPIPAATISGTLSSAQLPMIPAGQISGMLSPAQIPSLLSREVQLYAPVPVVASGTRASICWQADPLYTLSLAYQQNGRFFQMAMFSGPGQYRLLISQRTLFTLTAMVAGQLAAQHQIWIDTYSTEGDRH
jgi:hypothetical protein